MEFFQIDQVLVERAKTPLGLVFLKQNGQKLSLDNFRVYFSSVTGSKWEGRHLKHDIF